MVISAGKATGESYMFTVTIICLSMRQFRSTCPEILFHICREMMILRQVEIVVIFIAIFLGRSMLSFAQYEMKSSEATPFRGSIFMRFVSLELPQVPLHASLASKSVEK